MDVEIVFSGICAFNNVKGTNTRMGTDPSVTLVRTDRPIRGNVISESPTEEVPFFGVTSAAVTDAIDRTRNRKRDTIDDEVFEISSKRQAIKRNRRSRVKTEGPSTSDESSTAHLVAKPKVHVPYLAFDTTHLSVNDLDGFVEIENAKSFKMLPLNGVEIVIQRESAGKPRVDESYDLVLKRDDYWPEVKDLDWNRELVPLAGKQPTKAAAVGFMRFGGGVIASGRLAPKAWRFVSPTGKVHIGVFPVEVIYSDFSEGKDTITIELRDIESRALIRDPLVFTAKKNRTLMRLFVGNNDPDDIDIAVRQSRLEDMGETEDFVFLNMVADEDPTVGPIPTIVDPNPGPVNVLRQPVGSLSSGPCGPINTNGG